MDDDADEATSEDDEPIIKKTAPKKAAKNVTKVEETSGPETPKPKRSINKPAKEETNGTPRKGRAKKKEDEGEEVFKWWEAGDPNGDGTIKWHTLEHHGVIFPPPYEPLPPNVKMNYNGNILPL